MRALKLNGINFYSEGIKTKMPRDLIHKINEFLTAKEKLAVAHFKKNSFQKIESYLLSNNSALLAGEREDVRVFLGTNTLDASVSPSTTQ